MCVVLSACSSSNPDEPQALSGFAAQGVRYELGLFPNSQGPEAPCVGLSHADEAGASVTMACPTEEDEVAAYAATLQAGPGFFVVGYGTEEGETVTTDGAVQSTISQHQDGRHYFAIELRASPGPGPFELKVTSPDGSTRSILSHGLAT